MAKAVGRTVAVTPFRRLIIDLMHFSQQVPSIVAERRMDLGPLVAARRAAAVRPSWTTLFAKAYAMVGRDYPELRRAYLKSPWPRYYEHPHSVVALNVARRLPGTDEEVVLICLVRAPENRPLAEIDAKVQQYKDAPLESLRTFVRSRAMGRLPWVLRRPFFWGAINLFGRRRAHNFGTFGITSIAAQGAGLIYTLPLLTSQVFYGLLDPAGRIDVRMAWDHRVMDGAIVGRVLSDLESVLNRDLVRELTAPARRAA